MIELIAYENSNGNGAGGGAGGLAFYKDPPEGKAAPYEESIKRIWIIQLEGREGY